jgi:hypothetical protein
VLTKSIMEMVTNVIGGGVGVLGSRPGVIRLVSHPIREAEFVHWTLIRIPV